MGKVEMEKVEMEKMKVENEKLKVEMEKVENEKLKVEMEKMKVEMEKVKVENEKLKVEKEGKGTAEEKDMISYKMYDKVEVFSVSQNKWLKGYVSKVQGGYVELKYTTP